MSLEVLTIICGVFIVTLILCYKIAALKTHLTLSADSNQKLITQNQLLQQENINYLKTIEQLNAQVSYLQQVAAATDKTRNESLASAKATLFDLGNELSKQLIEIHKRESQEVRELSEKNIAATTTKFHGEFERLLNMIGILNKDIEQSKEVVQVIKQALLSPTSAGRFAEITLENILKSSGLRNKLDFAIQYNINGLEHFKLRPDAVIFLPSGNLMIIDAKASQFLLNDHEPEQLVKTMNSHLKSLSNKDYAEHILTNFQHDGSKFNNIITLMFLPTEHAVEKIINADQYFMDKAWAANIFPVGPTGLMNMLSFAKFQIADQMRAENHQLILDEVRKLLLSIVSIAEHSQKLGANIQGMVNNYDKFAGSFNRHLLSRAKQLQKLGVDTGNKTIPLLLERYHLVSTKSELQDLEIEEESKQLQKL